MDVTPKVPGKLQSIAVEIFERAYGLGRAREDHEILKGECIQRTGCSPKAFEELIYGHSYPNVLGHLRLQVPGYKKKEPRQRTPGDRSRGKTSPQIGPIPNSGGGGAGNTLSPAPNSSAYSAERRSPVSPGFLQQPHAHGMSSFALSPPGFNVPVQVPVAYGLPPQHPPQQPASPSTPQFGMHPAMPQPPRVVPVLSPAPSAAMRYAMAPLPHAQQHPHAHAHAQQQHQYQQAMQHQQAQRTTPVHMQHPPMEHAHQHQHQQHQTPPHPSSAASARENSSSPLQIPAPAGMSAHSLSHSYAAAIGAHASNSGNNNSNSSHASHSHKKSDEHQHQHQHQHQQQQSNGVKQTEDAGEKVAPADSKSSANEAADAVAVLSGPTSGLTKEAKRALDGRSAADWSFAAAESPEQSQPKQSASAQQPESSEPEQQQIEGRVSSKPSSRGKRSTSNDVTADAQAAEEPGVAHDLLKSPQQPSPLQSKAARRRAAKAIAASSAILSSRAEALSIEAARAVLSRDFKDSPGMDSARKVAESVLPSFDEDVPVALPASAQSVAAAAAAQHQHDSALNGFKSEAQPTASKQQKHAQTQQVMQQAAVQQTPAPVRYAAQTPQPAAQAATPASAAPATPAGPRTLAQATPPATAAAKPLAFTPQVRALLEAEGESDNSAEPSAAAAAKKKAASDESKRSNSNKQRAQQNAVAKRSSSMSLQFRICMQAGMIASLFVMARVVLHAVAAVLSHAVSSQAGASASASPGSVTTGLLIALPVGSMALLVVLLSRSWRAFSGSQELPLRLAAVVESYAENWELLAVEDPVQLNAALTQVRLLLDGIIAGIVQLGAPAPLRGLGASTLLVASSDHEQSGDRPAGSSEDGAGEGEHEGQDSSAVGGVRNPGLAQAVRVLDFLHSAHKNLVCDFGATPLISALIGSVRETRELLVRTRVAAADPALPLARALAAAVLAINCAVLALVTPTAGHGHSLGSVSSPLAALAASMFSTDHLLAAAIVFLLTITALFLISLSSPLGFSLTANGWAGGLRSPLASLLYVRSRIIDKERDAAFFLANHQQQQQQVAIAAGDQVNGLANAGHGPN